MDVRMLLPSGKLSPGDGPDRRKEVTRMWVQESFVLGPYATRNCGWAGIGDLYELRGEVCGARAANGNTEHRGHWSAITKSRAARGGVFLCVPNRGHDHRERRRRSPGAWRNMMLCQAAGMVLLVAKLAQMYYDQYATVDWVEMGIRTDPLLCATGRVLGGWDAIPPANVVAEADDRRVMRLIEVGLGRYMCAVMWGRISGSSPRPHQCT
ncbi:hypothetical protein GGX14DRAFT_633183 [Mycena pura]|uniref:Uncharacterized protein n=1 Tax=Mycena pura TaxID=153505 RepID=A0AAD6VCL7_9AGAR|nr:hypothetical protein GGX14DRAFT_633183 [Mycena pura]